MTKTARTFWRWFKDNSSRFEDLRGGSDEHGLLEELNQQVQKYSPNIVWEIGHGPDGKFELVISACGYTEYFPQVNELIDAAPQIDQWVFTAFKQPGDVNERISFNGKEYKIDDFWFTFVGDDQRGLIVLHKLGDAPDIQTAAILLLDNVVGEYDAATGIDSFAVDTLPDDPEQYEIYPMREIYERFQARPK